MWAIVAMRNSLVFHDFDKMTTLMMHASPALVAWWVMGCGAGAWQGVGDGAQAQARVVLGYWSGWWWWCAAYAQGIVDGAYV